MTEEEFNKRPLWKLVERLNFDKELAAWEEHLLKDGVSFNEAKKFIDSNKERVLFAYLPHYSGGGMVGIIYNENYLDSEKMVKKYTKMID